jgi:hypothetical protein
MLMCIHETRQHARSAHVPAIRPGSGCGEHGFVRADRDDPPVSKFQGLGAAPLIVLGPDACVVDDAGHVHAA